MPEGKKPKIEELLEKKRDKSRLSHVPEDPAKKKKRLADLEVASAIAEARYKRKSAEDNEKLTKTVRDALIEASGEKDEPAEA
jgi:hypothetical protein